MSGASTKTAIRLDGRDDHGANDKENMRPTGKSDSTMPRSFDLAGTKRKSTEGAGDGAEAAHRERLAERVQYAKDYRLMNFSSLGHSHRSVNM